MKPTILVDPFPRTMELIFSKDKLNYLKSNYKLIKRKKVSEENFYNRNISNAKFCEIGLNQNKTSLYYKDYDPPIKELSSLSISLLDTNGTIIDFCNLGHKLEFIISKYQRNNAASNAKLFCFNSRKINNG